VILCEQNQKDVLDIPAKYLEGLNFLLRNQHVAGVGLGLDE